MSVEALMQIMLVEKHKDKIIYANVRRVLMLLS